ncbi:hypothetical protein [Micromonospora sp. WMMD1082]|uniref:hypothetical protein n=1 Tax=Micromonospora sp. WMMD1082 TaxID=3016104 RepID=UPI0024163533|nr:hypothetical protein [Micromonospora sp. WMMD1082]MDG4792682.1 hypothetical protein [Micromonospora sp. WMMD1082]
MTEPITIEASNPSGTPATLHVAASVRVAGGLYLGTRAGYPSPFYSHFSPAAARELGAWLVERYALPSWTPKEGDEVRILPDAEDYEGDTVSTGGATRGEVVEGVDRDGDIRVKLLNGTLQGCLVYMLPRFVAHADAVLPADGTPEPAGEHADGTPVVIVTDDAQGWSGTPARLPKGTPAVIVESARVFDALRGYVVKAMRDGALTAVSVRPGDVALSMPAEPEPETSTGTERPWQVGDVGELTEHYMLHKPGDRIRVTEAEAPYDPEDGPLIRGAWLDGEQDGPSVFARRLRRVVEAGRPWAVGDEAIVTEGGKYADRFRTGERVRISRVAPSVSGGTDVVRATSIARPAEDWALRTDVLRRP